MLSNFQRDIASSHSVYLDLPESLGACGRRGRLPQRGPEEDVLLLPVLVTGQKLLLLGMKQPYHISLTEDTHTGHETAA